MRVDRKLNLVFPIEREDGTTLHVFSTPLRRETFEMYSMVIAKVFTRIHAESIAQRAGPRITAMLLKSVAQSTYREGVTDEKGQPLNWWTGEDGVELGLMGEIRRLTNVLVPAEGGGWEQVMYDIALRKGLISEDEQSEVDGAIAFFIVVSAMHRRAVRVPMLAMAAQMWGWSVTYSSITEFRSSLTTSTTVEDTGTKTEPAAPELPAPPSSLPI